MHFLAFVTTLAALVSTASAAPTATNSSAEVTAAQLVAIAPKSASCINVTSFADECRTADQASPFINAAFAQFHTQSLGQKAALLSLIAFETGEFRFNINHFPGRPGQGTRNQMMFPFVWKYALDVPEVASQAQSFAPTLSVSSTVDELNNAPNATKDAVLDLVLPDKFTWASASWFLTTQCNATIATALDSGTEAGWETYITKCIFTTVTAERKAYYTAALAALSS